MFFDYFGNVKLSCQFVEIYEDFIIWWMKDFKLIAEVQRRCDICFSYLLQLLFEYFTIQFQKKIIKLQEVKRKIEVEILYLKYLRRVSNGRQMFGQGKWQRVFVLVLLLLSFVVLGNYGIFYYIFNIKGIIIFQFEVVWF